MTLVPLTSDAKNRSVPPVLLPYQKAWIADESPLKVCEKSRRIGLTWAEACDDVLIAAKAVGTNVFYIGPTQDMALEYIEACAMWARAFHEAATEIEEGLFDDGSEKEIKTYKINLPGSGRRIVALSSRPTNLRGKQGVIVIDEAAFHPDLNGLLKAALAMLLWGDRVRIISTHDGLDNAFNELIQEIRAKKRKGEVHRYTFRDAVEQGLYKRVCLRRGIEWTAEGEAVWVKDAYNFYGDDATEELDVVPSQGGGAYLPMGLIESRMSPDTPVVRGRWNAEFNLTPEPMRRLEIDDWCNEHLAPVLASVDQTLWHALGQDFGRVSDLTVITLGAEGKDLVIRCKLVVELANCPFAQQEQILIFIIDALRLFRGAALDATGNGAATAEKMADKYGVTKIEQVKLSESFYLENFPVLKGAIEDATFTDLPRDSQIRDDLRAVRLINGVPKLPSMKTQKGDGQKKLTRHGDAAISCLMLSYAMKRDVVPMEFQSTGVDRVNASLSDFLGV